MKHLLLIFMLLALSVAVQAQLSIDSGAQFTLTGNAQVTLNNLDLINNGGLNPGTGSLVFTGKALNKISGIQHMTLYDVVLNKDSGIVQLSVPVSVSHFVTFTSGLFDLNNNDLSLGSTGSLSGEQEISHVIGSTGGNVVSTIDLNAPSAANPGNMGLSITSAKNLGSTTIRRGHQAQTGSEFAAGYSVSRYYDVAPAVNSGLNATLRFTYLRAELNGLDATHLIFYEKQTDSGWVSIGYTSRDTSGHYVQVTGLQALGRLTVSPVSTPLPVQFVSFDARCNGNAVILDWKTADEVNIAYYSVQRSADGFSWSGIASVAAAANPAAIDDYSFADNTGTGSEYYRIAEYDRDGKYTLSRIVTTSCNAQDGVNVWPNPVSDRLYIRVTVRDGGDAAIRMFDAKGALVRQTMTELSAGPNLLHLDVKGLAAGVYFVYIGYSNGQTVTQQIMITQ